PAGTNVPVGSYDRTKGQWVPEENGIVLTSLSSDGGLADIDADGDDIADDEMSLELLGINLEERSQLAELYLSGQSLWRVPISHFTEPYDCNWGPRYPDDADDPPDDPDPPPPPPGPCNKSNASSIECETQVLRETLAVAGTDLTLNYASD